MKRISFTDVTPDLLALHLNLPVKRLFQLARRIDAFYWESREQVMESGKIRIIDEPRPWLKAKLRLLHGMMQDYRLFHTAAHGGVRGRSCFTAARRHLGAKAVATRDITDCFPSVTREQYRKKLIHLGFRSDTACLLSGLMTCRDRIPQGSPTSNDALNLYLFDVDQAVTGICGKTIAYTRTADDHVISGNDTEEIVVAAQMLELQITNNELTINEKKKSGNGLMVAPEVQLVHAIAVNHPTKTRINKQYSGEYIELAKTYVEVARSLSPDSLDRAASLRRRLLGSINYARQGDISPVKRLISLMKIGDHLVEQTLTSANVTRSKKWWVKTKTIDRATEYSGRWKRSIAKDG